VLRALELARAPASPGTLVAMPTRRLTDGQVEELIGRLERARASGTS
jgi:hypothetical protein